MFEIHLEWEDAPGVVDPLLARTWARMEFRVNGHPITRYWSDRTESRRDGVYSSVFPLAQWVADNWWSLLYEGLRQPPSVVSARAEQRTDESRQWLRRHNLHTCREGMAYPDLTVFRKEDEIVLHWFRDPPSTTTMGRFVDEGMASVDRGSMETALESFMVRVLERIRSSHEEPAQELESLWAAIKDSRRTEAAICQRLAMLGQDPYAEDLGEGLENTVDELPFSEAIVQDLLSASTPGTLSEDVRSTVGLLGSLPSASMTHVPRASAFTTQAQHGLLPYRVGYMRAAEVRKHLGILEDEPLRNLDDVIERVMGEPVRAWVSRERTSVEAAVQINGVAAISASDRPNTARRFLLGRALHHWLYATSEKVPQRLLTKSHDWLQASSRAFAAELLAPASALSSRLAGGADWERPEELAQEFDVHQAVIVHQIDNHGLA